jgi:hypothetical protein
MQTYVKQTAINLQVEVDNCSELPGGSCQATSSTGSQVEGQQQVTSSSSEGLQGDLESQQAANLQTYNDLAAVRVLRHLEAGRDLRLVAVEAESHSTGSFPEPPDNHDQQQPWPIEFEGRHFTVPYTFMAFSFIDLVNPVPAVPVEVLQPVCART